jgi:hypothetical protein
VRLRDFDAAGRIVKIEFDHAEILK